MTSLAVVLVVITLLTVYVAFLLGFGLGKNNSITELHRIQFEADLAERDLHDLTEAAFLAMAEAAEQRGPRPAVNPFGRPRRPQIWEESLRRFWMTILVMAFWPVALVALKEAMPVITVFVVLFIVVALGRWLWLRRRQQWW